MTTPVTAQPVRFGLIGCGIIADIHAKGIQETPEAELTAVYDFVPETAARFGQTYSAAVYESLEEMLARDDLDVVCICTPSGLHAGQAVQAAKAGKHVFVEKPMAITMADLDDMIRVSRENGVLLSTVFPRRMSPAARYARELIREGRLGKLSLCSGYVNIYRSQDYYDSAGWRGTWAMDGGGAMMNQGIHTVDLLQWLAGPVASLYGKAKAVLRDIEVEDTAVSVLQFENGALGLLEITTTAHLGPVHRIEIHGERGSLVIEDDDIVALKIDGEPVELPEFEPFKVIPDGHRIQIRDMALAVREGRESIVPGTEGRHSLEIILGTYESARTGKEIAFQSAPARYFAGSPIQP